MHIKSGHQISRKKRVDRKENLDYARDIYHNNLRFFLVLTPFYFSTSPKVYRESHAILKHFDCVLLKFLKKNVRPAH